LVEIGCFECVGFTEGDFKGEGGILTESGPIVVGKGDKGVDVQICVAKESLEEEYQIRNLSFIAEGE
jgi:hypothetical protein